MKNSVILLILIALTGCASMQNVVNAVPSAVGTVAATAIFGGTVSVNPDPAEHVAEGVNRESRQIYNDTRRNTTQAITDSLLILFTPAK